MSGAFGAGRLGSRRLRSEQDRKAIEWAGFAAGLGIALAGALGNSVVLVAFGGLIVAALGAVLAPQLLLALFLVAGGLKSSPWLAGLPVDLTLLSASGVLVAVGLRALRPDGIRSFPPAAALGLAVAALVSLSVLWAPDSSLAIDKALRFQTLTMIAFFAPLVLVRSRGDLQRLMLFLVLASLAIALTAVPGTDPNEPLTVAGGDSEIELALYSSSGLVAAAYLLLVPGSRLRILWLVPIALLGNTVIAAGSRGVLLGSILALSFIAVLAIARSRFKFVSVTVVAVAAVAAFVTFSQLTGPAAQKYAGLFGGDTALTVGKRNFLVQDGIQIALDHPMGIGVGGYQFETRFIYPHNMLVEIAAEQGFLGLALLLALLVAAVRSSRRAREGPLSPESILAGGLLVVLVADAMVSQSFTEFRLLWFAFGLALAVPWMGADPDGAHDAPDEPLEPRPALAPG